MTYLQLVSRVALNVLEYDIYRLSGCTKTEVSQTSREQLVNTFVCSGITRSRAELNDLLLSSAIGGVASVSNARKVWKLETSLEPVLGRVHYAPNRHVDDTFARGSLRLASDSNRTYSTLAILNWSRRF